MCRNIKTLFNFDPPATDEEYEDPRAELVERLLEYQRYQGSIETLRLWEEERAEGSSKLRLATLERLGGAERVVAEHLERALGTLTSDERDEAARVFNHLVTPSGTKIAHGLDDLAKYAAAPQEEVREVVEGLTRARVLRPVAAPDDPRGVRFEIFHDVLAPAVLAWRLRHESERALVRERAMRRASRAVTCTQWASTTPGPASPSRARCSTLSLPVRARTSSTTGPVSRPGSICMMVTPETPTPARIAPATGAAPRKAGSSEKWTLTQPSRGSSSTAGGRMSP